VCVEGSSGDATANGLFIMSGGVIGGNTADYSGGGVCLTNGTMYMYGSAVIGNANANEYASAEANKHSNQSKKGSGIMTQGLSPKLFIGYSAPQEGQTAPVLDEEFSGGIYYNYASETSTSKAERGGAIFVKCDTIKIANCKIKYNTSATDGGGIFEYMGSLEIINTEIAGNHADNQGGGIYGTSSYDTVGLANGTVVIGNTATQKGNGVYGNLKMKGSAYVASNNDVYLDNSSCITITGALNPPAAANGISATITPTSYSTSTTVLSVADSVGTTLVAECGKFAITPQNGTTQWTINKSDGNLKVPTFGDKDAPSAVGDIVFSDGTAVAYSSNLQLSDAQKNAAVAVIYKVSGSTKYGVGLNEASLAWAVSGAIGLLDDAEINNYCYDTSNGLNNRSRLDYADADESHYPAIFWSGSGLSDGYLPSSGELSVLMSNKTTVNNSLGKLGKTTMTSGYWSSTVSSTTNAYYDGSDNTAHFTTQKKVRFIKKF
jgi:hypothetical protein